MVELLLLCSRNNVSLKKKGLYSHSETGCGYLLDSVGISHVPDSVALPQSTVFLKFHSYMILYMAK